MPAGPASETGSNPINIIRRRPTRESASANPDAQVANEEGIAKIFESLANSDPRNQSSFGNHATASSRSAAAPDKSIIFAPVCRAAGKFLLVKSREPVKKMHC